MTLQSAYDQLRTELIPLYARPELAFQISDVIHHLCAAIVSLDEAEHRRLTYYDGLGEGERVLAHEAHRAVIGVGQALLRLDDVDRARDVVDTMLDALAPFVSRADQQLRHVLLDGDPLEDALERIAAG